MSLTDFAGELWERALCKVSPPGLLVLGEDDRTSCDKCSELRKTCEDV